MECVKTSWQHRTKPAVFVTFAVAALSLAAFARIPEGALRAAGSECTGAAGGASAASRGDAAREAFLAAYKVFMHPRCLNCHPAGDVPLQGDDSRPHAQNVKRGPDGKGKYALKCANCHQEANLAGENMPPGSPNWH